MGPKKMRHTNRNTHVDRSEKSGKNCQRSMDDTDGHALRIDLLIECVEKHKNAAYKSEHEKRTSAGVTK